MWAGCFSKKSRTDIACLQCHSRGMSQYFCKTTKGCVLWSTQFFFTEYSKGEDWTTFVLSEAFIYFWSGGRVVELWWHPSGQWGNCSFSSWWEDIIRVLGQPKVCVSSLKLAFFGFHSIKPWRLDTLDSPISIGYSNSLLVMRTDVVPITFNPCQISSLKFCCGQS